MVDVVNERTTAYLTVSFKDKTGALVAPSTVTYSVYCMTNNQELRAATSLGAASTIEIVLGASDNAIVNQANGRERRRVTVKSTYGVADELNDQFEYYVQNLERAP